MTTAEDFRPDDTDQDDTQKIEEGFTQMEMIYRSRCVQAPLGSNVIVREVEKDA